mgnify:CR=1 FL=1
MVIVVITCAGLVGISLGLVLEATLSSTAANLFSALVNGTASGVFLYVSLMGIILEEIVGYDHTAFLKILIAFCGAVVMALWSLLES